MAVAAAGAVRRHQQRVERPEQPRRDVVRDHHVHRVVPVSQQHKRHAQQRRAPHGPVNRPQLLRRVLCHDQVTEHEHHRVPRIDVVAAVRVLAVYRQPEPGDQIEHSLYDQERRRSVIALGAAHVSLAGHRQHRHEHRDRPVQVQQADHEEDTPSDNEAVLVEYDDQHGDGRRYHDEVLGHG